MKKNEEQTNSGVTIKKYHWGRYLWLTFFTVVLIAVALVYRFAQKPAEGIIKPATTDSKVALGSDVPQTFSGKYVSFMYNNSYTLKLDELAKDSADVILERVYLSESGAISKKINLTIRSLPSRNLPDDPDYLMRQLNPKRYKLENFAFDKIQGVSFVPTDDSQFEKTYFSLHNDLVVTLTLTAPATANEKLNKEADLIIKSLTWQK